MINGRLHSMIKDFIKAGFAFLMLSVFSAVALQAAPFDSILNKNGVIEQVDSGADTYEYIVPMLSSLPWAQTA